MIDIVSENEDTKISVYPQKQVNRSYENSVEERGHSGGDSHPTWRVRKGLSEEMMPELSFEG